MKAAYIDSFGEPGHIRYGDLPDPGPDPGPGPGEVLVRAEAVAVNTVGTFVRSGAWRTPVTFPLAVGRDMGKDRRIDLDQWQFYTRELQLLGFIMSAMTAGGLAAAAAWINDRYAQRPLEVSVGRVLSFSGAALAHTLVERGELPRMPDHTVGRLILRPGDAGEEP